MNVFRARTKINSPLTTVWQVFSDPGTWQTWYGGELESVDPGWAAGAVMRWKLGSPSRLVEVVERAKVVIVSSLGGSLVGTTTTWTFASAGEETDVEIVDDFTHSATYASDPNAVSGHLQDTLKGLKQFVEARTPTAPQSKKSGPGAQQKAKPWWRFW